MLLHRRTLKGSREMKCVTQKHQPSLKLYSWNSDLSWDASFRPCLPGSVVSPAASDSWKQSFVLYHFPAESHPKQIKVTRIKNSKIKVSSVCWSTLTSPLMIINVCIFTWAILLFPLQVNWSLYIFGLGSPMIYFITVVFTLPILRPWMWVDSDRLWALLTLMHTVL